MATTNALLFSVAEEIRSFKSKAEVVDLLADAVGGELRERIDAWRDLDLDSIRATLEGELLQELKAKLPGNLQFLLRPVGELDDHLIDLGTWSKEDAAALAPVKVTASVNGSVELDGVLDEDLADVLEGPVPNGSALFTVSLGGKIGIDARGTAVTPLVSLSVTAGASRSQTLAVGFLRDANQPVLPELLCLRDHFVHPADLASVMAAFRDKTARLIQHRYHGTHSLGLKIALERDLAKALGNLAKKPSEKSTAEMSFSVNFKNADDYVLTVERDSASSAFVNLKRMETRERTRIFKLGASIEIKGLTDQIVNEIGKLLPESAKVKDALAKLDELVDGDSLPDLVKAELADRFGDHAALFQALLDNTPVDDVKNQILDELASTLGDRVNERVNLLTDEASAAATSVAHDVAIALGIDAAQLRDFLAASLGSAISGLQTKFAAKIATLNSSKPDTLQEILDPFVDAAENVNEALNNLGKTTANELNKVKAGIEEIYSRYTGFRQKLIELVNERVMDQAAFSFISESVTKRTDTTLLCFRIVDANADGVAELYSAIWSRRLDEAWALIQRAKTQTGITDLAGTYVSVLENQKRAVLSLDLFGLKVSTRTMFSETVAVGIDQTGKLVVAETQAKLQIARRRLKESQALSVDWSFDLVDEDPTLIPPIKIAVEIADKKLRKKDLRDFFASLNKLACVKPDAFDTVATQLLGGVNSDKKLEDAKLGLIVALTWNDLGAILGANRDGSPRADKWTGAEVARELFHAIKRGHPNEKHFADLEQAATSEARDPLGLLFELGTTPASKIKLHRPKLQKYSAIGRSMDLLDKHLEALQAKWLELCVEFRASGSPEQIAARQQAAEELNKELRAVLTALFLSNTFAALPDPSDVWQVASGARVLLDRTGREHLMLTIAAPLIARRIIA